MIDSAIQEFLDERKSMWLKKRVTNKTSDEEKEKLEKEANEEYSLTKWLPIAAKRAGQLSYSSHPGKFSHPDLQQPNSKPRIPDDRITSVIAISSYSSDGFLRSGNVEAELDLWGNAGVLPVCSFLNLVLKDGKTILAHLEEGSEESKKQLTIPTMPFDEVKAGLLAMKQSDPTAKTNDKIKQVYCPIGEGDYHLLSVLTPSGIVYKLKERIDYMRWSDEAKEVREAKRANKPDGREGYDIPGLSMIGYGGTKPQNISVLNNQNGGKAYLLSSLPPTLATRKIQPPRKNFFSDTLWLKKFEDDFQRFHELLIADANNIHIRTKRDRLIRSILYDVADTVWLVRTIEAGWSDSDNYALLSRAQKIWLDQKYSEERRNDDKWFESVTGELGRWFVNSYSTLMKEKGLGLGDDEIVHIKKQIAECEEALR